MTRRFLRGGGRPLLLGHRGASADEPENTLAAFAAALLQGADGVELDVMRCGSGEVVVVHDDDLRRVAGAAPGSERPVRTTPLVELQRYDLGGGQRVPTLGQVLEALGGAALVNVELKSPEVAGVAGHAALVRDDGLAAAVLEELRRAGRLSGDGRTLISSFDPFQLWRFRRRCAEVPVGFLFHKDQAGPLRSGWPAGPLRAQAVHPEAALVDAPTLRRFRAAGWAVHVWTVDDPREVRALVALGVDGIITNRPAAVLPLLS